jgi:hypothetical protein
MRYSLLGEAPRQASMFGAADSTIVERRAAFKQSARASARRTPKKPPRHEGVA